jgi:hypothetical protein
LGTWSVSYGGDGYAAATSLDGGAAKIDITSAHGLPQGARLSHPVSLRAGTTYTVTFRARADRQRDLSVVLHQWQDPWTTWATLGDATLDTSWRTFELSGVSSGTDPAAMINFRVGEATGTVWLDDVKLQVGGARPDVWRRDFENGVTLVNPTEAAVRVSLAGTFRKIKGIQDPTVNDGSVVSAVTIPAHDGLVLLRTSSVTLTSSASTLRYGDQAVLSIVVSPDSTGTVRLERRLAGATQWLTSSIIALDGSTAISVGRSPGSNTEYRAVLVGPGVVSDIVKVTVTPSLTIRASRTSTVRGGRVTFSGAITHPGRNTVVLQRSSGSGWKTVRRFATATSGRYSTTLALTTRGTLAYRVRVEADTSHLAAVSSVVSVRVR